MNMAEMARRKGAETSCEFTQESAGGALDLQRLRMCFRNRPEHFQESGLDF